MTTRVNPQVFWVSLYLLRCFSWVYFRGCCQGREHYPQGGPFIIAINHNSLLDIPIMALAVDRPMFAIAKESLFKMPVMRWWLQNMGFFPVKRGATDTQAFDTAREVLKRGDVLAIAPEGTRQRSGSERPRARTGIVRLAQEFHCPIIPVGVIGTRKAMPPGAVFPRPYRLKVRIGKPINLEPVKLSPENRHIFQKQADQLMDIIYELSGDSFTSKQTDKI